MLAATFDLSAQAEIRDLTFEITIKQVKF